MAARPDPGSSPGPACAKCGAPKHYTGSRWRCSRCFNEWQAARRRNLTEEQRAAERRRANANRLVARSKWTQEKRQFENARTQAWRETNRERHREVTREWYRKNGDRAKAAKSAEYLRDPAAFMARNLRRKARLRDAVCEHGPECVTAEFLAALYASACLYCGSPAEHADHFDPLARGGLHCVKNLVPACGPCNTAKSHRDPAEWMASLGLTA